MKFDISSHVNGPSKNNKSTMTRGQKKKYKTANLWQSVGDKVSWDQNFTRVNLLKVEQNSDAIFILSVKFFDFILLRFLMIFLTTLLFEVVHYVFWIVRCEHTAQVTSTNCKAVHLHRQLGYAGFWCKIERESWSAQWTGITLIFRWISVLTKTKTFWRRV